MHEQLRPFDGPLDLDAAAHLWRRAAFSAPLVRVEATARKAPAEAAAEIVDGPADDAAAADLETIYGTVVGAYDDDQARAWLVARMLRCEHQLREKVALFWHGHFATSIAKVRDLGWMMRQYRLFLDLGLGRFGELLAAVTRDPAMIRWLDNESNAKGRPNENFARELFELFTLGDGNYTEGDIREAARAFTGWHVLRDRFHFSTALHDDGAKTVLGRTGAFGGDDVLAIALGQEACGRFLARKLLAFFVCPEPDAGVVDALGAEMRANGYDMKATLRLLLSSRYFFAPANRRALVKSPLEYLVGAARVFGAKLDAKEAVPVLREMGQDLLAPPNVKGWPGHALWVNTATWLSRVNAAHRFFEAPGDADRAARALLGRPLEAPEKDAIAKSGAGGRDLAHALLSLPEASLS
jgi:uncharacterized protein (DUF1800 family)